LPVVGCGGLVAAKKSGVFAITISPPRDPHLFIPSAVTICAFRSPSGRSGDGPSPRCRASLEHGHLAKIVFEKSLSGRARLRPSLAEPARGCCRRGSAGASPYHGWRLQTGSQASTVRCQFRRSAMLIAGASAAGGRYANQFSTAKPLT
jgi:hypothetical protein